MLRWSAAALAMLAAAGCGPAGEEYELEALPAQQAKAYPETVTGRFVSLADFEEAPLAGAPGYEQVRHFALRPSGGAQMEYVVNITRTGVGALGATLPVGTSLVYTLPDVHDFSEYTLLAMALHSPGIRDNLQILIVTDRAGWQSPPLLLRAGWNNLLIDIQRLKSLDDFNTTRVREIRLRFSRPAGLVGPMDPVRIYVDDIMLIDNRRDVVGVPAGMRLVKSGLDYDLHLPGRAQPVSIRQGFDGLWRMGAVQAVVRSSRLGDGRTAASAPAEQEDIESLGWQRRGELRVVEHNAVRLRLANTWYFPVTPGSWQSLDIRRIHWEYTFHSDGRMVTAVTVERPDGQEITVTPPAGAVWSDGRRGRRVVARVGAGGGRQCYLAALAGANEETYLENFVRPGRVDVRVGRRVLALGDADRDGFDESQNCYRLQADGGNCRFFLVPPPEGLADPVVRVAGRWISTVSAAAAGQALRQVARLPDGSVLFVLPGRFTDRTWVEVTGKVPLLPAE